MATMSPVQKTAFEASSRKLHAVTKGYITDPYIHYFAHDRTVVNSPLMNRGYWLRTTVFENALVNFARQFPAGTPIQVISLGSGFDTLYFRWASNPTLQCPVATVAPPPGPINITKFVELDVAEMVQAKQRIIHKHRELEEAISSKKNKNNNNSNIYHLTACDLAKIEELSQALESSGVSPDIPTFILAECVLVYLPHTESTETLKYLVNFFTNNKSNNNKVLMASYDMMKPDDRFGQMMISNLTQFGLNIDSIEKLKGVKEHEERCVQQCGFHKAKGTSMKALYTTVSREAQLALNKLEIIDDWDEWGIVHDHYCFVQAYYGPEEIQPPFPPPAQPTFGTFTK